MLSCCIGESFITKVCWCTHQNILKQTIFGAHAFKTMTTYRDGFCYHVYVLALVDMWWGLLYLSVFISKWTQFILLLSFLWCFCFLQNAVWRKKSRDCKNGIDWVTVNKLGFLHSCFLLLIYICPVYLWPCSLTLWSSQGQLIASQQWLDTWGFTAFLFYKTLIMY